MRIMVKKLAIFFMAIIFSLGLVTAPIVKAANKPSLSDAFGETLSTVGEKAGYSITDTNLDNKAIKVIQAVLSLLGVIFVSLIIYSGIRWMTAGGNDQTLEKAKETIRQAIMGLLLIIGAYAISLFIFKYFT